jgi:Lon protease-like protein
VLEAIPLFPLGTVLFPGVVLPLHVFEPRYRTLVRELMEQPEGTGREFGVVAIRQGWEVGEHGATALYRIGCTAELRQAAGYDDGRFDIVTVGRRRFRLDSIDGGGSPYLRGSVRWLSRPAEAADAPVGQNLTDGVREVFGRCRALLHAATPEGGGRGPDPADQAGLARVPLPDDPELLSYLVGATAPLTLDDRQSLLSIDDTVGRLRRELRLLKREAAMLARLRAVPVPLAQLRVPLSPN